MLRVSKNVQLILAQSLCVSYGIKETPTISFCSKKLPRMLNVLIPTKVSSNVLDKDVLVKDRSVMVLQHRELVFDALPRSV